MVGARVERQLVETVKMGTGQMVEVSEEVEINVEWSFVTGGKVN